VLITAAGVYELFVPPAHSVVLANLHPGIWWGGVLLVMGIFYSVRFRPATKRF
jgi:hypothetical protein